MKQKHLPHHKALCGISSRSCRKITPSLEQRTLFRQKLPADFKKELATFQQHVTGLDKWPITMCTR